MPTRAPIHRPAHTSSRQEVAQSYNQHRGSAASRGYDRHWARVRDAHLQAHPLCRHCQSDGVIKAAELVDHVVPVRVDESRRLDETNLQSLCTAHHAAKTEDDRRRWPTLARL